MTKKDENGRRTITLGSISPEYIRSSYWSAPELFDYLYTHGWVHYWRFYKNSGYNLDIFERFVNLSIERGVLETKNRKNSMFIRMRQSCRQYIFSHKMEVYYRKLKMRLNRLILRYRRYCKEQDDKYMYMRIPSSILSNLDVIEKKINKTQNQINRLEELIKE